MADCNIYCQDELDDHTPNDCDKELLGSSDQGILLDCDHGITDPSNATQVNDAIAAGKARHVKNVKIGMPAPSPINVDSLIGGLQPKLVNYDRTLSLIDPNVSPLNCDFWAPILKGRTFGGLIVYEKGTEDDEVTYCSWIDAPLSLTGGRVLPDNNAEFQRWEITATWRSQVDPKQYVAPTGVF